MEKEMAARGVGQISRGFGEMTPNQLLNDPNTTVVLVRAAIPPGAPEGTRFDVFVQTLPGASATSLEGGRLWTTDLFRGNFTPGGPTSMTIAHASGQIFINPFTDPAKSEIDAVSRTSGRILNGGVDIKPLDLLLVLDNPSHARARSIVSAINAKFPQDPGDRHAIAMGRSEEIIQLYVPKRYQDDTPRFVQLLMHTRLEQLYPQEYALRYARALREQPELAESLMWSLQAVGKPALPELRRLYDYSELAPRLAALEAGAGLEDPLVEPHLIELAKNGPAVVRTHAIELLGKLKPDPSTNIAIRSFLDSEEMDVRIAAYESLRERFDPAIIRTYVEDKFILDSVPFGDPMIYVTQQGRPRIVVFGKDLELNRPALVTAWDDRLMFNADSPTDDLRVYYRDFKTNKVTTAKVKVALPKVVELLAHKSTPEAPAPGLDLTYSEVVGALHEIWKANGFPGAFVAEQDRLMADLYRSTQTLAADERPETDNDSSVNLNPTPTLTIIPTGAQSDVPAAPRSYVVPLKKPAKKTESPS